MKIDKKKRKECAVRLKNAINECGVTQKWLADQSVINEQYLSDMCTGKRPISEYNAKKIAKCLNEKHERDNHIVPSEIVSESHINDDGSVSGTARTVMYRIDYYDYQYFTGEIEEHNLFAQSEKEMSHTESFYKSISVVFRDILASHGYTLISPETFDPLVINTVGLKSSISFANNEILSKEQQTHYMKIKQISTGKIIDLSFLDTVALFNTISNNIGILIDGIFYRNELISECNKPIT